MVRRLPCPAGFIDSRSAAERVEIHARRTIPPQRIALFPPARSRPIDTRSPDDLAEELGYFLGQRSAFAQTAGRCTAAYAAALREIHDQKLYLRDARSWEAFCQPGLKITRRHADNLIGLHKRFGPIYFELNHLVGLTPDEFALIEPSIRHDGIEFEGKVIALKPANTAELAEAIATRRSDNTVPATSPRPRIPRHPPQRARDPKTELARLQSALTSLLP